MRNTAQTLLVGMLVATLSFNPIFACCGDWGGYYSYGPVAYDGGCCGCGYETVVYDDGCSCGPCDGCGPSEGVVVESGSELSAEPQPATVEAIPPATVPRATVTVPTQPAPITTPTTPVNPAPPTPTPPAPTPPAPTPPAPTPPAPPSSLFEPEAPAPAPGTPPAEKPAAPPESIFETPSSATPPAEKAPAPTPPAPSGPAAGATPPAEKKPPAESNDIFATPVTPAAAPELKPAEKPATDEGKKEEKPAEKPAGEEKKKADEDIFSASPSVLREAGGLASDETRLWVDNTGSFSCHGRLVRFLDGKVRIMKENGRTTTVPLARLSAVDLEFVNRQASAQQAELHKTVQTPVTMSASAN
jgi:hypothetical protein